MIRPKVTEVTPVAHAEDHDPFIDDLRRSVAVKVAEVIDLNANVFNLEDYRGKAA